MTRKDFVKSCAVACAAGLGCSGVVHEAYAAEEAACNPEEMTQIKNRADAARLRFARLVEVLENRVPADERRHILNALGARCAATYKEALLDRFKGNIHGFLEEGLRQWMAEAQYDAEAGTIRVVDKGPHCTCPMVQEGQTPGSFCDCTLGWQEAAYSAILGRPAKAELEESILRGGKRCVYRMKIL